jgi:predicted nuclease of predicted toxin-antitoxin system
MKILIDMNLSPDWVGRFAANNIESVHWSTVGDPKAEDVEIMAYAHARGYVVFTHDLDFGALLAATQAKGPSVIQVRTRDVLSETLAEIIIGTLKNNEFVLDSGSFITVDEVRARVRVLPLRRF